MGWQKPETWRGKCAGRKQAGLEGETVDCQPMGVQGTACWGMAMSRPGDLSFPGLPL